MGGGFTKKPYRGEGLPKRWGGRGAWRVCEFKGEGLGKKDRGSGFFFFGGGELMTQCTL